MGQKVHPHGLRLGIIRTWESRWYAPQKNFAKLVIEDEKLRRVIKKRLYHAAVSRIEIERAGATGKVTVNIWAARPGIIIGKKGAEVEGIRKDLKQLIGKEVYINIREIKNAEVDAQLVAENIASQLERRVSFRRAMKKTIQTSMNMGALGIKIICGGRLGGAEIARTEKYMEGSVPLHTLRANVEYGVARATTTYGIIGVKCWIYKEEIIDRKRGPVNIAGAEDKATRGRDSRPQPRQRRQFNADAPKS
jgi:small subunit ribosomal protein S3